MQGLRTLSKYKNLTIIWLQILTTLMRRKDNSPTNRAEFPKVMSKKHSRIIVLEIGQSLLKVGQERSKSIQIKFKTRLK